MTTVPTKLKDEQITFTSSKTGTHELGTYLEASELGTGSTLKSTACPH